MNFTEIRYKQLNWQGSLIFLVYKEFVLERIKKAQWEKPMGIFFRDCDQYDSNQIVWFLYNIKSLLYFCLSNKILAHQLQTPELT